ncbi:MAG: disulfide bond formation protein B [Janthinobacterium lividum]
MNANFSKHLNLLALLLVDVVLGAAFYVQITLHELPCPLCLLQRIAFAGLAVGLAANVLRGRHPAHYGGMILVAVLGMLVAVRQMLLHIAPTDPGFGSLVMGMHMYTWAALVFLLAIVGAALMLLIDFSGHQRTSMLSSTPRRTALDWVVLGITVLFIFGNAVNVFMMCGLYACPENP